MPAVGDQRQRVVVLDEQLAGGVEAERAAALGRRAARARAADDDGPSPRPSRSRRARRPARMSGRVSRSGRVVRLPAVQALRPEPAAVDPVARRGRGRRRSGRSRTPMSSAQPFEQSTQADWHPALRLGGDVLVHATRPRTSAPMRSAPTPRIHNSIGHPESISPGARRRNRRPHTQIQRCIRPLSRESQTIANDARSSLWREAAGTDFPRQASRLRSMWR